MALAAKINQWIPVRPRGDSDDLADNDRYVGPIQNFVDGAVEGAEGIAEHRGTRGQYTPLSRGEAGRA